MSINRNRSKLDNAITSSDYRRILQDSLYLKCTICPPNKGCNSMSRRQTRKSWKNNRKNQYHARKSY